jgi:hypothetical protein
MTSLIREGESGVQGQRDLDLSTDVEFSHQSIGF